MSNQLDKSSTFGQSRQTIPAVFDMSEVSDGFLFHTKKGKPVPCPAPMAPLADSHGHLTSFTKRDPADAVARAALAGVRLLVVPLDAVGDCETRTTQELLGFLDDTIARAQGLLGCYAEQGFVPPEFPGYGICPGATSEFPLAVRFVAGVHPYGAESFDDAGKRRLSELLAAPTCVGVGEIGLDYTCEVAHDVQLDCFREQLEIARAHNMPVELHIRDEHDDETCTAHADAAALLREIGVPKRGCDLHCYTGTVETMRPFLELGCHIAFGGAATFKKSDDIRAAAVACPASQLLSETDCPYMAPVPVRGVEGEPGLVAFSAACVAEARAGAGVASHQETYDALWFQACTFFDLLA